MSENDYKKVKANELIDAIGTIDDNLIEEIGKLRAQYFEENNGQTLSSPVIKQSKTEEFTSHSESSTNSDEPKSTLSRAVVSSLTNKYKRRIWISVAATVCIVGAVVLIVYRISNSAAKDASQAMRNDLRTDKASRINFAAEGITAEDEMTYEATTAASEAMEFCDGVKSEESYVVSEDVFENTDGMYTLENEQEYEDNEPCFIFEAEVYPTDALYLIDADGNYTLGGGNDNPEGDDNPKNGEGEISVTVASEPITVTYCLVDEEEFDLFGIDFDIYDEEIVVPLDVELREGYKTYYSRTCLDTSGVQWDWAAGNGGIMPLVILENGKGNRFVYLVESFYNETVEVNSIESRGE